MNKVTIIMGGQFGSEGKGEFTAWYSKKYYYGLVIRTGGPNAGHTITVNNKSHKMRQIPCAWHTNSQLALGPGCAIDLSILEKELEYINEYLLIDRNASLITLSDIKYEKDSEALDNIGSTCTGTGASKSNKILRIGNLAKGLVNKRIKIVDLAKEICLNYGNILIESTQGFGLSLNYSGFYPYVTSSDIIPTQILADAGIANCKNYEVIGIIRTYPIRVAGNSGPLKNEITFESIRQKPEYTTVTNKIRRIAEWDIELANNFGLICKPDALCLTFVDYLDSKNVFSFIKKAEHDINAPVKWISTGPGKIEEI